MEAFPPEIINEILLRLPAESLLRFKTVCKSWNSLIKTPAFIKSHLNQTLISNSHRRLLKSSKDDSKKRKFSFYSAEIDSESPTDRRHLSYSMLNHPLEFDHATLFGSCNGVVSIHDYSRPNNVLLYNPLTKSRRILPAEGSPSYTNKSKWVSLLYGFGYDSKTEDYKVLRIAQEYPHPKSLNEADHVCSVYSLNNDCWKSVSGTVLNRYTSFSHSCSHGVLVNETLHYLVMSTPTDELDNLKHREMIVCFDLRTESFWLMDCPNHDENNNLITRCEFHLAEFDGCLCVMLMNYTKYNYMQPHQYVQADLLVMKEYGNKESWSKVFSIRDDEQLRSVCISFSRIKPIAYSKDKRRILIDINGGFVTGWFDLEEKKFEKRKHRGLPRFRSFDTVGYFMASLVSVGQKNK